MTVTVFMVDGEEIRAVGVAVARQGDRVVVAVDATLATLTAVWLVARMLTAGEFHEAHWEWAWEDAVAV